MSPDLNHGFNATCDETDKFKIGEVKSNSKDETTFVESGMLETLNVRLAKFVLHQKLSRSNVIYNHHKFYNEMETEASQALLELVNKLLDANLPQFENLLREMDYSELSIGVAFSTIAEDVLHGDNKDITWTRIGILFAFAVMMAKSCLPSSSPQFLDNFGVTIGNVIEDLAGFWIEQQGGWKTLKSQPSKSVSNVLLGMVGLGTTVLGAAVTIFSYSQSSAAFTSFLRR